MSKVDQKIIARFDELIERGENPSTRTGGYSGDTIVQGDFLFTWKTNTLSLLGKVMGIESVHYTNFDKLDTASLEQLYKLKKAVGILKAAKEDYGNGYLFDLRKLVEAEIFDDLLEQAEQLLNEGYYIPAAVLAGCVLEDGLRKLCDREGITLPDQPKLNWMNDELAKKNVYNALTKKNVTSLAAIRNDAAHGKWVGLTGHDAQQMKDEVGRMIPAVRSFLEYHLS